MTLNSRSHLPGWPRTFPSKDGAVVDLKRTVVSSVISQQEIDGLPINGRDFISFSLITPGVTSDRTPQQGSSATSGLTFAGQRARANNIMVDGLDNNDTVAGSVRAVFSQESVREFQVLTSSYSAEFGKASGGIVNIVTKSGTNQVSGNAFMFLRNEKLNAKEHFEQFNPAGERIDGDKAPYSQKQFGATLGGPLRRDRTFYFLSFERLDAQANNFVTIDDQDPIAVFGQSFGSAADILRRAGFPVDTGHVPYAVNSSELFAKLNHQLRSSQSLDVRFGWATGLNENIEPWGGQVARSRGASLDNDDFMIAASHTSVLSPKVVNELRSQVAYRNQTVMSLDPTCLGRCDSENEGGPTLEVTGVASVGRQRYTPQAREALRYQVLDTLSFQRSYHMLKVGFDYNYINHLSASLPLHFGGRYIFAPLPAIPGILPTPISSIQALALGLPAAYVQGYGNSAAGYTRSGSVGICSGRLGDETGSDSEAGRTDTRTSSGRLFGTTCEGWARAAFPSDGNNIAPRLAVAWTPKGNRQLVIHGAYGIFFENQLTSLAGIADIVDGSAGGIRTLVRGFPSAVAAWNAPDRRLPESAVPAFPSLAITIDPALKTPCTPITPTWGSIERSQVGSRWPQTSSMSGATTRWARSITIR